ncbi:pirin family protein [Methylonatrum kenyense]|uniref:pirin family protein n=1 Tax=Methylonatrum kenyense TaxID=455253 RepID=UPI0020BF582F|nr:pirin family protein [Methylonatrum kenyense]MCK8515030.1 pirin family protein [Methylonatrum kenyense]
MKAIQAVYGAPAGHWVGDGFPVRSLLSYDRMGAARISPFLMLDHAGPVHFPPADRPRGVGQHPHRGFETVTIVYQGELEHRDSTGAGGRIGPGDVQWMTAGAGIVHEEFHSRNFTAKGGTLEMAQLWVNLPARDKSAPAAYQTLLTSEIPDVALPDDAGRLRVIAGQYLENQGPASTFSPMNVWDVRLRAGAAVDLPAPEGHNTLLVVLDGTVQLNQREALRKGAVAALPAEGEGLRVEANSEASLLLLSGEPLDEPVAGYGPFVMNSREEIEQAFADFRSGKYGAVAD